MKRSKVVLAMLVSVMSSSMLVASCGSGKCSLEEVQNKDVAYVKHGKSDKEDYSGDEKKKNVAVKKAKTERVNKQQVKKPKVKKEEKSNKNTQKRKEAGRRKQQVKKPTKVKKQKEVSHREHAVTLSQESNE